MFSLSGFLRFLAVSCLVISFWGLELFPAKREVAVFLVDASESYTRYLPDALALVSQKLEDSASSSEAALVVFGANASVEIPLSARSLFRPMLPFQSSVGSSSTNIASGIERTISALPFASEVYLFTDGHQTSGDAEFAASVAGSTRPSGARTAIFPVIHAKRSIPDAAVDELVLAEEVKSGESFPVEVQVSASVPGRLEVSLRTDHEEVSRKQVEVPAAGTGTRNSVLFSAKAPQDGLMILSAEVTPLDFIDAVNANNRFRRAVRVSGPRSIILVKGEGSAPQLPGILEGGVSARVSEVTPDEFAESPSGLLGCDLVVLDDASADRFSSAQMENIRRYVEGGGGLLVLGGSSSFGPGGYEGTEIEKALPVWSHPQRRRNLSLVLILDASGSMGEKARFVGEGSTKFNVAAQAAASVIAQLKEQDRVEIMTFNVEPTVHLALSDVGDGKAVKAVATEKMARIEPGGGTNIYTALQKALEDLQNEDNSVRLLHILLLSDGESLPGRFDLEGFRKKEITVSVVATGDRVDREQLKSVCEPTGGVFYEVNRFDSSLRDVFLKDLRRIPNLLVREKETHVKKVSDSPVLRSITDFPPLQKLCVTSSKEDSQILLESDSGEPVLAVWNYGLGRSVAFTGSLQPGWGARLLAWEKTGAFLAQIVSWCSRAQRDANFSLTLTSSAKEYGTIVANLDARDRKNEKFLNSLSVTLKTFTPSGKSEEFQMTQNSPGTYSAKFTSPQEGLYLASALIEAEHERKVVAQSQFYQESSLEDRSVGINLPLLYRIASASGGKTLSEAEFSKHRLPETAIRTSREDFRSWRIFALLAALFYLADIALRAFRARARFT